jgi:translation initiation factor 2B subunit (eIF-2B alpha/beta/delta family)
MLSTTAATVVKMLETLPENEQDLVVEHMREYIAQLRDEETWAAAYEKTQGKLAVAARRARQEIAAGQSESMDFKKL